MKITSKEQILENCKWIKQDLLIFDLYSHLMKRHFAVELHFDPKSEKKEIRKETLDSIREFQSLNSSDLIEMQNAIWSFVLKNKSDKDLKHLEILSIDDINQRSKVNGVGFINETKMDHTFFHVFIETEWDLEHGIIISYFNGKLDNVE